MQTKTSINRGRQAGSPQFFMRLIWLIWVSALLLLVRSVWMGLELASSSAEVSLHSDSSVKRNDHPDDKIKTTGRSSKPEKLQKNTRKATQSKTNIADGKPATASHSKATNQTQASLLKPHSSVKPTATVAHAISFLSCGASLTSKYIDAMLLLRHSIHQNSIHATDATSKYSYKMYAFVNNDPAKNCGKYINWIRRMGYTPLLLPNPINISSIQNEHYRNQIDKTGVAGSSELIKLYLYTLTDYPIVVHWDIDVIVLVSSAFFSLGGPIFIIVFLLHIDPRNQWMTCLMPCFLQRTPPKGNSPDPGCAFSNPCTKNCPIESTPSSHVTLRLPGHGIIAKWHKGVFSLLGPAKIHLTPIFMSFKRRTIQAAATIVVAGVG